MARDYDVGLHTVDDPGSPEIQDSLVQLTAVGSRVLGRELPAPVRGVASLLGYAGRFAARSFAAPQGTEGPDGQLVRSRGSASADGAARPPRRGILVRTALWVVPILVGVTVAAVAWGLQDDRASLLIGLAAGASVGLGLVLFLLLGVLWYRPPKPSRRRRSSASDG